jgi:hypothetical protein
VPFAELVDDRELEATLSDDRGACVRARLACRSSIMAGRAAPAAAAGNAAAAAAAGRAAAAMPMKKAPYRRC